MPLYEYRCKECGRNYEQLRRMSDADTPVACPYCASRDTERKFSAFATAGSGSGAGSAASSAAGCGSRGRFS